MIQPTVQKRLAFIGRALQSFVRRAEIWEIQGGGAELVVEYAGSDTGGKTVTWTKIYPSELGCRNGFARRFHANARWEEVHADASKP